MCFILYVHVLYFVTAERAISCTLSFCGSLYRNHVPAGSVHVLGKYTSTEYTCCKMEFFSPAAVNPGGVCTAVTEGRAGHVRGSHLAEGQARRLRAVLQSLVLDI